VEVKNVLIDCQNHVFPREYVELLGRNPHPPQGSETGGDGFAITYGDVQQFRVTHAMYDPALKLRDMDRCGIEVALLSVNMPGPCLLADDLAPTGARVINDYISDLTRRHPDRFAGLASLPWQLPDEAIREMDRAAELNLRGVVLYSHVGGRPVDDPAFEPIYAHAEAKGLPIVLHPTVPSWRAAIKDHWIIPPRCREP
jgi:predicted TIM-barrel fold metal-dependent hydrolase